MKRDSIGATATKGPSHEPGTWGRHLLDRLAEATLHFDRTGNRDRRLISRAAICDFYAFRVGRARTCAQLRGLATTDVLEWLRRRSGLTGATRAALTKALYDVRRRVNDEWVDLRTTGALLVRSPSSETRLDSRMPLPQAAPWARAAESALRYGAPAPLNLSAVVADGSVRIDPPVTLRDGARVTVLAAHQDVLHGPLARPLAPGTLSRLVGLVSLGGDAVVDSERWEDVEG